MTNIKTNNNFSQYSEIQKPNNLFNMCKNVTEFKLFNT